MHRLLLLLALAAGAVIAAAPAGALAAADAPAGRKPPAPCKLLTRSEVAELLGEPVEKGQAESVPGARECDWNSPDEGTGGIEGQSLGLEVIVHTKRQALREFDELARDQDNETVDGVGDEAFVGEFATPVFGRVGNTVFEVGVNNYDTSSWDGDPEQISVDAAVIVGEELIRAAGRDPEEEAADRPEQPDDVAARFADDIPVPASFAYRTVFGTEYNGSGAFGGDLTIDEVVAFYEDALPDAGFEVGEITQGTNIDGAPATIIPFEGNGRTGQVEISPNTSPPGATLIVVTYETPEE
jgi:hypothetical protein